MSARNAHRAFATISLLLVALATVAAGCGADQALVGGRCAAGYVQCGAQCVDLARDSLNCGACAHGCASGACVAGECGGDGSLTDGAGNGDALAAADGSSGAPPDSAGADSTVADADTTRSDATAAEASGGVDAADDASSSSTGAGDANPETGYFTDANATDGGLADVAGDAADGTGVTLAEASTSSDADAGDVGEASDTSDAGPTISCVSPLVDCGGQCEDLSSDPVNCGTCGTICVSQLCVSAHCIGAASGGIVLIGHDYQSTAVATSQARVLSNAVFFSQSNPVHVMSYRRYADAGAVAHVNTILANVATQLGRALIVTNTSQDDDIPTQLTTQAFDVLLVHDQLTAPPGGLSLLGASWAATVLPFASAGGVVVVLDGGTGVGEMPSFVTATGLLAVTAHAPIGTGTQLFVTTPADVVGVGVVSPYAAGRHSVSLIAEPGTGNTVYVVGAPGDAGGAAPVVIHKAI